jgi:threonine/homoserine/homoserine lactone efflux protein
MEYITNFYVFLASTVLISMTGVLQPGPMWAVTIEKAAKRKTAGLLIAVGHGIIEFPLMFLIYYWLSQFAIPDAVPIAIGLIGGVLIMYMGVQTFKKRKRPYERYTSSKQESLIAGTWTTVVNAGFYLWWFAIGIPLILNAQIFGFLGFSTFAVVHWFCDVAWYTLMALVIFESRRFWTEKVHDTIFVFCAVVLTVFGAWFFGSALWSAISMLV